MQGSDAVKDSLFKILGTPEGERPMSPSFGQPLRRALDALDEIPIRPVKQCKVCGRALNVSDHCWSCSSQSKTFVSELQNRDPKVKKVMDKWKKKLRDK
jgi:hypothetical protein